MLLAYTDGVTEARDNANNLFSDKRLAEFMSSCDFESVEEIVHATISEVKRFENEADQFDDMTVLTVQFLRLRRRRSAPNWNSRFRTICPKTHVSKKHF